MRLAAARSSMTARSTAAVATGEQHDGLSDRYPRPPCQRNTDRCPRKRRSNPDRLRNVGIWGLRFGIWDLLRARKPPLGQRFDERVRDKPKYQQACKDIHREVVHLL